MLVTVEQLVRKLTTTQREINGDKRLGTGYGKKRNVLRYRYNIWKYNVGKNQTGDDLAFEHPAPFPEQLANDHILSWSNEGDLVLDPFMGSGTTAKMAKLNNRNYIGFEISKEYCEIAERRLKYVTNSQYTMDIVQNMVTCEQIGMEE